jgi:hypothetical protein
MTKLGPFYDLYLAINAYPGRFGTPGVRDPDAICEVFDGAGFNGQGRCMGDGHYLCEECSQLSSEAPRFAEYGWQGVLDRLELIADHIQHTERFPEAKE